MSLTNKTLANTYKDILQMDNSNSGVDTTTRSIKDGEGTISALSLSDDVVSIKPQNDNTTASFLVEDASGTDLLVVDSTNSKVSALGNYVNTQYAYFNVGATESQLFLANTHYSLCYQHANYGIVTYPPAFGTGTDPATTFTTSDGNGTRASDIVPCMWYVPDAISIDAVYGIVGADNATGDQVQSHLFSYDYSDGVTNCLTNGTLLAHRGTLSAGSEQPYLASWTVDSASVTSGKVILAFIMSDSVNSDYSSQIKVKYHLT